MAAGNLKQDKNKEKKKFKILRITAKILLGLLVFIILLLLFVRSPWGQDIIVQKLVHSVSKKTGTEIKLEKAFISFDGNVNVEGLYLEDLSKDTLVYSKNLKAHIALWRLISGNGVSINSVQWKGLTAKIVRKDSIRGFNYQFLIDAYATQDSSVVAKDSVPMKIDLGQLHFRDFDINYDDIFLGTQVQATFKDLNLNVDGFDLEKMKFSVENADLSDANIVFTQKKPLPESPDSTNILPIVKIGELTLNNVKAFYDSDPDKIKAKMDIGNFELEMPVANLAQNKILVDRLLLENSDFLIKMETQQKVKSENLNPAADSPDFEWPNWKIQAKEISFSDDAISYFVNGERPKEGVFNPNAIALKNIDLQLDRFSLENQTAKADLKNLSFNGESNIHLKKLAFETTLENDHFSMENLSFRFNDNSLKGNLSAEYISINDFLKNPGNAKVNLKIPQLEIALSDAFMFQPTLKNNPYLLAFSKKKLVGNLNANGTLSSLKIPGFHLNWGQNTTLTAIGTIKNTTDPDNLKFNFPKFDLVSTRNDVIKFIPEDSLGISIPEKIQLNSSFHGSPKNITATAILLTPDGKIDLNGSFENQNEIAFDLDLKAKELDLGKLLKNDQLNEITFTIKAKGKGANLNTLDADFDAEITQFSYNKYDFRNLGINGKIVNGSGDISMDYKDDNLDMAMETNVKLDSISPVFDLNLNLKGINLLALGLSPRDIRAKTKLDAHYQGTANGYDINASTENGVVVYDNASYLMGDINMNAYIRTDSTSVDITNKIVDLKLRSNAGPNDLLKAMQQHLKSYISEKIETPDTIRNPVQLQLNATVSSAPILDNVLFPGLKRLDTVKIAVDFNQFDRKLDATVNLPFINYNDNEIDSLQIVINSDKKEFEGKLSFQAVKAGPLALNKTSLKGTVADDRLYLDFKSNAENDSLLVNVHSYLNAENDSLFFHIYPKDLLLNGKKWDIASNNKLVLTKDFFDAKDFRLHRNNQSISIRALTEKQKKQLAFAFENFQLNALLSFLNPENPVVKGELAGDFILEDPFGKTGMMADLTIRDFYAADVPLGNLALKAESAGGKNYDFNLGMSGGDILLDLTGNYVADSTAAKLNMQLDLKKLKLDAIKNFTDGAITNTEGFISGNLKIQGTTAKPKYEGAFQFHDAKFNVSTLNAIFKITDQSIAVDTDGLYFDNFKITDENSSGFVVDGNISTESFINPGFDLSFEADNFKALNSTADDNELYYGTVVFDMKGKLTGDLNLPIVDVQLNVDPETKLTYVVPLSKIAVVSRDGIVVFVNKENPDDILTRNTEEKTTTLTGIIVNSVINISKGSVFSVILDEKTGDNVQVTGEGSLNFDVSENGRTHLSGRYNINDGHYVINLYDLVKRRFDIADDSSISWFGDPLEANLDITAVHKVETSAASLMAAKTSGTVATKFQQELTFLVYLYVDGYLMQPKLSFGIGMPEDERGSLGGEVYGTIQQLNQQNSELNKQVFSLLVLKRFYPQGNNYGAQGGALTLARDNLNQLLSDQMNMFSDRFLGDSGVNLNFGLDSYTDYQGETPQEKTALQISAEKHFLDDRLVVEVGSSVDIQGTDSENDKNQPLIENISIQYLLTEDGRFRLKGFRKNTFENVIDGQVIINGIALIFQKQFNEFKDLWKSDLKKLKAEEKKKDKNKAEKTDKKEN